MSRKPAGAKLVLASALLVLAAPLFAQEVGTKVEFPPSDSGFRIQSTLGAQAPGGTIVYDSGESGRLRDAWDTVLFHGTSSDPQTRFEGSRKLNGKWTPWRPAVSSRRPKGRFWGKVKFDAAAPGALRLRAISPLGRRASVIVLGVEAFLSTEDNEQTGVRQNPPPVEGQPLDVIGRSAWGAKPPKEPYEPLVNPYRITLHHTDGPQTMTVKDSEEEVRFIQDFHMNGRGWNDIAYHFLVDGAGHVFEGRPENAVGAHTLHNNDGNIGIAILGTYHPPKNDVLNPVEERAVAAVGRYLVEKYHIDPNTLKGHRDYRPTDCPGDLAYAKLGELRALFAQKPPAPAPGVVSGKKLPAAARAFSFDGAK